MAIVEVDKVAAFNEFKKRCTTEGYLSPNHADEGDDIHTGITDDGTLQRFLRARDYNVDAALKQYRATRKWRDTNRLLELYDKIDVEDYEETRKLYTHWTGRRARNGSPLMLFEIKHLTPEVMTAYEKSCSSESLRSTSSEPESLLRLFCTYESLIRFVMPLCSAVQTRPHPDKPITDTLCIVDVSGVSLMQFWRLRSHLQAASALASSHYPETLGRTYIIGAPSFFPTIWGWISKWFHPNTVAKIQIVPQGAELATLSKTVDPIHIPRKYGGEFDFDFGDLPDLDGEIRDMVKWLKDDRGSIIEDMPKGPLRWVERRDQQRTAIAVGSVHGMSRCTEVFALK